MRLPALLALAALAGCGASGDRPVSSPVGWTTFNDERNALTVTFPSTWRRAQRSLTPDLTDPLEIVSVGSFAPGPRDDDDCAQFPVGAMRAAGATDVFVSIQERTGRARGEFTPRERPFALGPADDSEANACVGGDRPWRTHWIPFADAGRPFYAFVLIGDEAPPERVEDLQAVLDGLRFEPSERFTAGRGNGGRLPPGWSLVRRRLAAAVSDENQIAAATFAVPPGPPDSHCTPAAALDRLGPDDAFVYVFAYDEGTSRDSFPPRPERFTLDPESLKPYECMGTSYLIRWREHGRGFQAHVYLGDGAGQQRQAEALRFLDDLVIGE